MTTGSRRRRDDVPEAVESETHQAVPDEPRRPCGAEAGASTDAAAENAGDADPADEAMAERRGGRDRRGGDDRRSGRDRRSGVDRRGQPTPAWRPEPDPNRPPTIRPYHFRSFVDRRESADRRQRDRRTLFDRRLGETSGPTLTAEELEALLGPDPER